jgi:hypothetical protein
MSYVRSIESRCMEIYEFFDLSNPILGDLDQRVLQRKRGIMDSFVEPDLV